MLCKKENPLGKEDLGRGKKDFQDQEQDIPKEVSKGPL